MSIEPIDTLDVLTSGPIRGQRTTISLTPFHAFIGPNDSGTTSLLRSMFRRDPETTLLLRIEWSSLVKPSDVGAMRFINNHGHGLTGILFNLRRNRPTDFADLVLRARERFPSLHNIIPDRVTDDEATLVIELHDRSIVQVKDVSEGLLRYMAFLALPHLRYGRILIDNPEEGLHPAFVRNVMQILRDVSKATLVAIATHSPLVINEMRPEEVTVITRDAQGVHATPMRDTPDFEERSKVYALGELWLSYCDGLSEEALLKGGPRNTP